MRRRRRARRRIYLPRRTALVRRSLLTGLFVAALAPRALAQPRPDALAGEREVPAGERAPAATDDRAKPADPTADVAAGSPAPEPPAAVATTGPPIAASSDAIDLSALGFGPDGAAFDDKLNIYGFADVGFLASHWTRKLSIIAQNSRTFLVGNLNLYLAKNLTAKARALAEVRFTFLPNGTQNPDGSFIDTTALDVTNFSRPAQWGGIVIERAYVEYDLTDHLTIRGGHWLTPYGIWNNDHGSPTIIGTMRPYIIGEEFFPEHQTGLDLFGSHYEAGFKLGYHATVSNGRGATEAQADQDNKFAFGGSLELETPWGLKVGGSYYRGRYTGIATTAGAIPETYLEAAYGGDAQYDHGGLHLQAEVIARDRHYAAGKRAATGVGFAPDGRDFGFYVLAGYRFDHLWNVMPYTYYEEYQPTIPLRFPRAFVENVGLNFRPTASLVFKLQATHATFDDGLGFVAGQTVYYYFGQACWVF